MEMITGNLVAFIGTFLIIVIAAKISQEDKFIGLVSLIGGLALMVKFI